tara:strand:- start:62 stop:508 length:447 start_codon:yes stop_codon:yes gene_type:complete
MNEFRNNSTGNVELKNEILRKYPNTSFPVPVTNTVIEGLGYTGINEGTPPSISGPYESYSRSGIEQLDGKWYTKYVKITYTGDDKTKIDADEAAAQRDTRDSLLAETDYLALSDVTMSDAWKTYRQALRDIPTASGWPHTHTWPTKPS